MGTKRKHEGFPHAGEFQYFAMSYANGDEEGEKTGPVRAVSVREGYHMTVSALPTPKAAPAVGPLRNLISVRPNLHARWAITNQAAWRHAEFKTEGVALRHAVFKTEFS